MTKDIYKLHVVERGKGRPVILLHGGLSTHRYWGDVAALLEGKRRLLLPDLLGFGASPKPRQADYSLEQYVACLEHTFDQYDFKESPVLVGHSGGALIALRWALSKPDKFSGLVLSSPLFFEASLFHQQMASIALEGRWLSNKALAKFVSGSMGLAGFLPSWLATRVIRSRPKHIIEDVTRQRFYVYRRLVKNTYFRKDVLADLQRITLPTRVLIGEHDPMAYHALEDLRRLCKTNNFCHIQALTMGHNLPLEQPEIVAKTILTL